MALTATRAEGATCVCNVEQVENAGMLKKDRLLSIYLPEVSLWDRLISVCRSKTVKHQVPAVCALTWPTSRCRRIVRPV